MSSFRDRLTARLDESDRLRPGTVPAENIAGPESLERLHREIVDKISVNETVYNKSLFAKETE